MGIPVHLKVPGKGQEYHPAPLLSKPDEWQLVTTDENQVQGVWNAVSVTSSGTVVVVTAPESGTIRLTDIILNAKKTANGTVTVQFDDGTNTEIIISSETVNVPVSITHSFGGNFLGWINSNIEFVTDQNIVATLTVGYIKVPNGRPYAQFLKER